MPRHVTSLSEKTVIDVAAGAEHSILCTADGEVYSFGWNRYEINIEKQFINSTSILLFILFFYYHRYRFLLFYLFIFRYGNLGLNDREDRHIPIKVDGIDNVVAVAAGWRHSLASRGDERQLYSWGWSK